MKDIILYTPYNIDMISNSVAFNIKNKDSTDTANILNEKFDICVRPGYHCAYPAHINLGTEKAGAVRISVSYFNKPNEIKEAIESIYKITKNVY